MEKLLAKDHAENTSRCFCGELLRNSLCAADYYAHRRKKPPSRGVLSRPACFQGAFEDITAPFVVLSSTFYLTEKTFCTV
jgi:hypothetical protein